MVDSPAFTRTRPTPGTRAGRLAALGGCHRPGDKQGRLALFAADGVVEDAVGPSVFDPEGKGPRRVPTGTTCPQVVTHR